VLLCYSHRLPENHRFQLRYGLPIRTSSVRALLAASTIDLLGVGRWSKAPSEIHHHLNVIYVVLSRPSSTRYGIGVKIFEGRSAGPGPTIRMATAVRWPMISVSRNGSVRSGSLESGWSTSKIHTSGESTKMRRTFEQRWVCTDPKCKHEVCTLLHPAIQ